MTSLWAAITSKRSFGHPNWLYFLNPECVRIPWVLAPKKIVLPKKSLFGKFRVSTEKKCCGLLCAQFGCHRQMSHIFWKLIIWRFIWYILGTSTCILRPVRFFVTLWFPTGSINWNLVLRSAFGDVKINWHTLLPGRHPITHLLHTSYYSILC